MSLGNTNILATYSDILAKTGLMIGNHDRNMSSFGMSCQECCNLMRENELLILIFGISFGMSCKECCNLMRENELLMLIFGISIGISLRVENILAGAETPSLGLIVLSFYHTVDSDENALPDVQARH